MPNLFAYDGAVLQQRIEAGLPISVDFPREAAKFVSILNYDGSPITARFIAREIRAREGVARRVQEAAE